MLINAEVVSIPIGLKALIMRDVLIMLIKPYFNIIVLVSSVPSISLENGMIRLLSVIRNHA